MCSGVVPQQPPTRPSPNSETKPLSFGQFVGSQRILGTLGAELRQAGIGHDRHRQRGVLGQMTEMFTHLGRPGGTVQTDHVDTEWLECRQRRTDLTAQEHRSGCLDRHVRDDRQPQSELLHRTLAAEDCSFHLKQVLAGFDEDGVGATVDHAERSFGVRVTQDCVRCVSQAGELGSRSHRAEYESGHAVAAWSHLVRYFTGESSAFFPRVRGSGERCRSRRGWAGCNRRCWSRRHRHQRRSTHGGCL